jgi:hypothetical protein
MAIVSEICLGGFGGKSSGKMKNRLLRSGALVAK